MAWRKIFKGHSLINKFKVPGKYYKNFPFKKWPLFGFSVWKKCYVSIVLHKLCVCVCTCVYVQKNANGVHHK